MSWYVGVFGLFGFLRYQTIQIHPVGAAKKLFRWKSRAKALTYLQKSEKFCDVWCCGGRCVHQNELVSKQHNFYLPCRISLKREILKSIKWSFLGLLFMKFKIFEKIKVSNFDIFQHIFTNSNLNYNLGSKIHPSKHFYFFENFEFHGK